MVIWNQTLIPGPSHLSFPYYFLSGATIEGECDSVFFPAMEKEKKEKWAAGSAGKLLWGRWVFILLFSRSIHCRPPVSHTLTVRCLSLAASSLHGLMVPHHLLMSGLFSAKVSAVSSRRGLIISASQSPLCVLGEQAGKEGFLPESCFNLSSGANLILDSELVVSGHRAVLANSPLLLFRDWRYNLFLFLCHFKPKQI